MGWANRLPILLPLSAYANALASTTCGWTIHRRLSPRPAASICPWPTLLQAGADAATALVLLDGLDEVKDLALRHTVVERVIDFYTFHGDAGNKFVLTSRIVGYRAVRPDAPKGWPNARWSISRTKRSRTSSARWTAGAGATGAGRRPQSALTEAARERQELLDACSATQACAGWRPTRCC